MSFGTVEYCNEELHPDTQISSQGKGWDEEASSPPTISLIVTSPPIYHLSDRAKINRALSVEGQHIQRGMETKEQHVI